MRGTWRGGRRIGRAEDDSFLARTWLGIGDLACPELGKSWL